MPFPFAFSNKTWHISLSLPPKDNPVLSQVSEVGSLYLDRFGKEEAPSCKVKENKHTMSLSSSMLPQPCPHTLMNSQSQLRQEQKTHNVSSIDLQSETPKGVCSSFVCYWVLILYSQAEWKRVMLLLHPPLSSEKCVEFSNAAWESI